MKKKNDFLTIDYAFSTKLKSKKGMATRDDRVHYQHRPQISTVGEVRVIQRG